MSERMITNNEMFSAMVDREWSEIYYRFKKFIDLYAKGQYFECLPEQPTEEMVEKARDKFEELCKALGYI